MVKNIAYNTVLNHLLRIAKKLNIVVERLLHHARVFFILSKTGDKSSHKQYNNYDSKYCVKWRGENDEETSEQRTEE